jgi:putative addiction module component (TIGR02574 family)
MSQPAFNYRDLPLPERLQLVEDIWDSIAEEANAPADALPLTEAQRAELERRLAHAKTHPEESIPWDTIKPELFKRGG